jgi:ATP-dependent DNA helicase RecG
MIDDTFLFSSIEDIIDSRQKYRAKLMRKLVGDYVVDALLFRPHGAISRIRTSSISKDLVGKHITTTISPLAFEERSKYSRRPVRVYASCDGTDVEIVFFNNKFSYLKKLIEKCKIIGVSGKLTVSSTGSFQFVHPEYVGYTEYLPQWEGISNIYSLTAGIDQRFINSLIKDILRQFKEKEMKEWIDEDILKEHDWPSFKEATDSLHSPQSPADLTLKSKAIQRLLFDEILAEQLAFRIASSPASGSKNTVQVQKTSLFQKIIDSLPFALTFDQKQAIDEIINDMNLGKAMKRLLQGDVGSGKTVVALLAAVTVIEGGYQCALLAPTELLAQQHFASCKRFLSDFGLNTEILTAYEKGRKRKAVIEGIACGNTNMLVGTHAIFGESVVFKNLGFVIVDEQHRFGVNQRLHLIEKGFNTHVLSMTATPIPRTLILSNYGDIEVSSLKNKPKGRKDIITRIIPLSKIMDITMSIKNIIKEDKKVYWVCPLIEESETLDYTCVVNRFEYLKQHFADDVLMMHGKMKQDEKAQIFDQFKNGKVHILVATTIIEVGVDVESAVVIIIENAEKFGLAQLHQLRGRVGRNKVQSYCILLRENRISDIAEERLTTIRNTTNGFEIAEKDLLLRGAGEILGTKQSGLKKSRFYTPDEYPIFATEINNIMEDAATYATYVIANNKTQEFKQLLKIFQQENFENLKKSF